MEAYNRFNKVVYEWERALCKFIGHDILAEEFRLNAISFLLYLIILSAITSHIYTMIYFEDVARIFAFLCIILIVQVCLSIFHNNKIISSKNSFLNNSF